jgi:protein-tyrosine phosphatase
VRIVTVCLGNICRSPIAQVILADEFTRAGITGSVESAGTGSYHEGDPMDPRASAALRRVGLDPSQHRARKFTSDWFGSFDLVLAMDRSNLRDLRALASGREEQPPIRLFREYDPEAAGDLDVADPYFTSGSGEAFDETVRIAVRTSRAIAEAILRGERI